MRLILASASPRRAELLRSAGYEFGMLAVDVDERVTADEAPVQYVERLAQEKAARGLEAVRARSALDGGPEGPHYAREDVIVLGADTAVVVDGEILGKPQDLEDAVRMLRRLSGRTHQVMTGVCLRTSHAMVSRVEISHVEFVPLTDDHIAWYVASGEGRDKAGGYAIQGLGSRFIPRIEGSYSNVVGLPIALVSELIRQLTDRRSLLASGE